MPHSFLAEMVRRQPPAGTPVVRHSTPVVAFGDPTLARVATLGINPSRLEFVHRKSGALLDGDRRLATLPSLGARSLQELSEAQAAEVVADCCAYFGRRPYMQWFRPLDELLRRATGASYLDGSACHLDLVQWATDPVWGKIPDAGVRDALLEDGLPHLRKLLSLPDLRLVLLNGRSVSKQVERVGLVDLRPSGELPLAGTTCRLSVGDDGERRWVAWSANLQSSFGISKEFRRQLADRVAVLARRDPPVREPLAEEGAT